MRDKLKNFSLGLFGLSLAVGIIWLTYVFLLKAWKTLDSINATLAVAIIAGTVSVLTIIISKHLEHRATIKNELRAKKIPIYEELIAFLFKIWRTTIDGAAPPTEKEILDFMITFNQKLLIWGSDDVVMAFAKFRKGSQNSADILFLIENIWFAIRKDLGHSNRGIQKGMLLGLIVNDIDTYMKKKN